MTVLYVLHDCLTCATQVPERVPFRLTRNLVDPMGVSGHEAVTVLYVP